MKYWDSAKITCHSSDLQGYCYTTKASKSEVQIQFGSFQTIRLLAFPLLTYSPTELWATHRVDDRQHQEIGAALFFLFLGTRN